MGSKTRGGSLVALGLAAAAYWLWGMKKEDKEMVKEKVRNAGNQLKDKLPSEIKDKFGKTTTSESNA